MEEPAGVRDEPTFGSWLRRPEVIVGFSALLLSVCGLGVAIYEASLYRQSQHASVWPHVQVAASLRADRTAIWVRNTGIGPARIEAAAVTYEGELLENWTELIRRLMAADSTGTDIYYSLISGRVLPVNSEREDIFALTPDYGEVAESVMSVLRTEILEGDVDVSLCYCSVYDDCWTSDLQDMVRRVRGDAGTSGAREVRSCTSASRSAI